MLMQSHLSLSVVALVSLVNGTFEEVFLLGFLMRGLRGYGLSIAFGVPSLVRILCHVYQGPLGTISVLAVGLVFGAYYVRTTKLWPAVFAHILLDFVPLALVRSYAG
jgi:membrane protease YdiL (CAAX protease family)